MLKVNLKRRSEMPPTEYKECPYCGGKIAKTATKCKHCLSSLGKWERAKPFVEIISIIAALSVVAIMWFQLSTTRQVLGLKHKRELLEKDVLALEEQKKVIVKDIVTLSKGIRQYSNAIREKTPEAQVTARASGGFILPEMPSLSKEVQEIIKKYDFDIRDSTDQ